METDSPTDEEMWTAASCVPADAYAAAMRCVMQLEDGTNGKILHYPVKLWFYDS